ncbi:MAG: PAAR domain-containing protein [Armatimonadota bacterium]
MRTICILLLVAALLCAASPAFAPPAARVGDTVVGTPHCHGPHGLAGLIPHPVQGPIIIGCPTVLINGKPAARVQDTGTTAACCGPNTFTITLGSATVLIGGRPAARQGDATLHCGMVPGTITIGSPNVLIGP